MKNSKRTDLPPYHLKDETLPLSNPEKPNSFNNINIISGTNFYTLFESASEGIFLLDGDKVVDCNNKTLEMFACSREQIINHSLDKYLPPTQPDGSDSQRK